MKTYQTFLTAIFLIILSGLSGCLQDSGTSPTQVIDHSTTTSAWDSVMNIINSSEVPNRGVWQKPNLVLDQLGNIEGKVVADIGAGSGYFTLLIPRRGANVIAIDIDTAALNGIQESMNLPNFPQEYRDDVELRLVTEEDPQLSPDEVDAVIIINTVSYIQDRVDYMKKILEGLKPGGILLIVDYKTRRIPLNIPIEYRVPLYQIEDELYQAGFSFIQADDCSLDFQYLIKATKTS